MTNTVPLSVICQVVADYHKCEQLDIFNKSRKRHIIMRRQWFHYLARTLNPEYVVSSAEIGRYYSDVIGSHIDHATVLNSVKKMRGFIESYKDFKALELYFVLRVKLENGSLDYPKHMNIPENYFCAPMKYEIKTDQAPCSQNQ